MQILPGHLQSGSIVLNENIPTLSIGRTLVATVLSAPKSGQVLVSMFGRRIMVETTMALHRGQVLNLKVHALSPRIVLKLADSGIEGQSPSLRNLGNALSRLVGSFGDKPIESFLLQEIVRRLPSRPGNDAGKAEIVAALAEQLTQHPEALASCSFLWWMKNRAAVRRYRSNGTAMHMFCTSESIPTVWEASSARPGWIGG